MAIVNPDFDTVVSAIAQTFNTSTANVINTLNSQNVTTAQEAFQLLKNTPYELWYTYDGKIGGVNIPSWGSAAVDSVAGELNSNLQNSTQFNFATPISGNAASGSGNIFSAGAKLLNSDIPVETVASKIGVGVTAVNIGAKLGKFIDSALYNANPNFWNEVAPTINPETWDSIAGDSKWGAAAINWLFGIDKEKNEVTPYVSEDALAYFALMMAQTGFFDAGSNTSTLEDTSMLRYPALIPTYSLPFASAEDAYLTYSDTIHQLVSIAQTSPVRCVIYHFSGGSIQLVAFSENPFSFRMQSTDINTGAITTSNVINASSSTWNNITFYSTTATTGSFPVTSAYNPDKITFSSNQSPYSWDIAYILFNGIITTVSPKEGVTTQPSINIPTTTNWATPETTLADLKTQYPDLWNNAIYQDLPQEDGDTKRIIYVPMPITDNTATDTQPTNEEQTQDDTVVTPTITPQDLINTLIQYIIQPDPDPHVQPDSDTPTDENPPDTGEGNSPAVIVPTGNASALWSVYNPSLGELNSLGAWLWSSNFIDQLLKLFNDPMQAIIGLHKIFAPPAISGAGTIKVGYLDSGVSSNLVGSQYSTVDCGAVNCYEYFGNVLDYDPHTKVSLFLPFIGIVKLNTAEVMRGVVRVVYHVDVFSGACLAEVQVTRDGGGGTLYTYAGDASVRYPISSGSYMGMVSGVLSVVGGIAGTIASGGALAPALLGSAAGVSRMHTDVQHSGSISGNAGAMGAKRPYLIISRPQSALASNYKRYTGVGANETNTVSAMSGYFKMSDVRVNSVARATREEKNEIKRLLELGVYT